MTIRTALLTLWAARHDPENGAAVFGWLLILCALLPFLACLGD